MVDIDLHDAAGLRPTWFTLFSPRIQKYTVGVEPADRLGGARRPSRPTRARS